ncbi:hypothetical protein ACHAPT_010276 [Fusarium lateritium]
MEAARKRPGQGYNTPVESIAKPEQSEDAGMERPAAQGRQRRTFPAQEPGLNGNKTYEDLFADITKAVDKKQDLVDDLEDLIETFNATHRRGALLKHEADLESLKRSQAEAEESLKAQAQAEIERSHISRELENEIGQWRARFERCKREIRVLIASQRAIIVWEKVQELGLVDMEEEDLDAILEKVEGVLEWRLMDQY